MNCNQIRHQLIKFSSSDAKHNELSNKDRAKVSTTEVSPNTGCETLWMALSKLKILQVDLLKMMKWLKKWTIVALHLPLSNRVRLTPSSQMDQISHLTTRWGGPWWTHNHISHNSLICHLWTPAAWATHCPNKLDHHSIKTFLEAQIHTTKLWPR